MLQVSRFFHSVFRLLRFDEFLLERIFKPSGMKETYFSVPEEKQSRVAAMYKPNGEGGLDQMPGRTSTRNQTCFSGGGGLSSTISDYALFACMMLNGCELDGIRLIYRGDDVQISSPPLSNERGGLRG